MKKNLDLMIINPFFKIPFVLVLILVSNTFAFSQKQNLIGVNLTSELTSNSKVRVGVGLNFERQITAHSGYETGLYYRTNTVNFVITIN